MKQEFIRVGRIVNAHGIRGEVRVQPRRVSPALLTRCKTFYIDGQPITPTANHVHKELVLLKLPGVDDMNAALALKDKDLYIRREDAHLEDFIRDDEAGIPVDEAGRQLLRRELLNVLKSLTPREERVIALRFGLEDGRARTLEELGQEFHVTRERVRQIEAKALRKLRHPSRAKRLRDYLEE